MKVFFVKYNDPIYVKLEKLDIMIRLASQANIAQVLAELKEYATEVDVDFVRKAVRAIGRCAIKVEQSAERCVSTLLDLIQTKVNYVVQEAIVVIKDIFRKYPNKYVPTPPGVRVMWLRWRQACGRGGGNATRSLSLLPDFSATGGILKRNLLFFLTSPESPLLHSPN